MILLRDGDLQTCFTFLKAGFKKVLRASMRVQIVI
jgi:hypothetical protein